MSEPTTREDRSHSHVHVYRGGLPLWLAVLILAPLSLLLFASLAVVVAGGLLGAALLPLFRRRRRHLPKDQEYIELNPSDYRRVDTPPPDERR